MRESYQPYLINLVSLTHIWKNLTWKWPIVQTRTYLGTTCWRRPGSAWSRSSLRCRNSSRLVSDLILPPPSTIWKGAKSDLDHNNGKWVIIFSSGVSSQANSQGKAIKHSAAAANYWDVHDHWTNQNAFVYVPKYLLKDHLKMGLLWLTIANMQYWTYVINIFTFLIIQYPIPIIIIIISLAGWRGRVCGGQPLREGEAESRILLSAWHSQGDFTNTITNKIQI